MIQLITDMGFDEATAREALRVAKNRQSYACEWLIGNRSKIHQAEQCDGLPNDSPILKALLSSPHVQLSLSSPKMFIGKRKRREKLLHFGPVNNFLLMTDCLQLIFPSLKIIRR